MHINIFTGFFDPLKLSSSVSETELKRWRESELKHGRIAMLAVAGILAAEKWHPLFKSVQGPSIYHFQEISNLFPQFWWVSLAAIGLIETITITKGWESPSERKGAIANLKNDYVPGDLGFDPLRLNPAYGNEETFGQYSSPFNRIRNKELQNGRLAMLGVAGMVLQELVDGRTILEHYLEFGFKTAPHI